MELLSHARPDINIDAIWQYSFPKKTESLEAAGTIDADDKRAFDRYNDLRNDFAHIFGHSVTLRELLEVALHLEQCGVDFSDSVGSYSEAEATEYYGGPVGVMAEISWCILYHVSWTMFERGIRDLFAVQESNQ